MGIIGIAIFIVYILIYPINLNEPKSQMAIFVLIFSIVNIIIGFVKGKNIN